MHLPYLLQPISSKWHRYFKHACMAAMDGFVLGAMFTQSVLFPIIEATSSTIIYRSSSIDRKNTYVVFILLRKITFGLAISKQTPRIPDGNSWNRSIYIDNKILFTSRSLFSSGATCYHLPISLQCFALLLSKWWYKDSRQHELARTVL